MQHTQSQCLPCLGVHRCCNQQLTGSVCALRVLTLDNSSSVRCDVALEAMGTVLVELLEPRSSAPRCADWELAVTAGNAARVLQHAATASAHLNTPTGRDATLSSTVQANNNRHCSMEHHESRHPYSAANGTQLHLLGCASPHSESSRCSRPHAHMSPAHSTHKVNSTATLAWMGVSVHVCVKHNYCFVITKQACGLKLQVGDHNAKAKSGAMRPATTLNHLGVSHLQQLPVAVVQLSALGLVSPQRQHYTGAAEAVKCPVQQAACKRSQCSCA